MCTNDWVPSRTAPAAWRAFVPAAPHADGGTGFLPAARDRRSIRKQDIHPGRPGTARSGSVAGGQTPPSSLPPEDACAPARSACLPEHAASAGAYRLVPSHAAASVAPCVRLAPAPHSPDPGAPPPRRPQSTKPALAGALKDRSFDLVLPERLELFLQNQQRRRLCQGLLFAQQLALQLLVFILQRTQLPRPRRRFFATQTKGLFPTRQVMGKQTPFPAPCL